MTLVEEAAAYLDGPGRAESRALARPAALAYSTESMRLTTRLMQVASWLLLQRAVNEGELTPAQARAERLRVKLSRQELGCAPEIFEQLPPTLRGLSRRSLRIQERVIHLDQGLAFAHSPEPSKRGRRSPFRSSGCARRFRIETRQPPLASSGLSVGNRAGRLASTPFWPHWSARCRLPNRPFRHASDARDHPAARFI